jgi:putative DNA modification/repair radical SAM protein
MSLEQKLRILSEAAKYDVSCATSGALRPPMKDGLGHSEGRSICHSFTPDGRCVALLKILLTNHCIYDCVFCVNRASSDVERACFTPEEVAHITIEMYKRNYIEGLFLSSGIFRTPDTTMEQLVRAVRILRTEHRFNGYIHLKAIPGASTRLIEEAGLWVDRLSANIELPTSADLAKLAPEKSHPVIEHTMDSIDRRLEADQDRDPRAPQFAQAGQTTQMVIGATDASDAEILSLSDRLYRQYRLRRIYYSAFSPIPNGDFRLPLQPPPLLREHRLYQADWLMRHYRFDRRELIEQGNLDLSYDPKLAWALRHREQFPVDVNCASRERLLRVPGIGYKNVLRIISIRRYHRLGEADLRRLGVVLRRARPFIVAVDMTARQLDTINLPAALQRPAQLNLFDGVREARSGQL